MLFSKVKTAACFLSVSLFSGGFAVAADEAQDNPLLQEIYVLGGAEELKTLPGSASLVDREDILAFDTTDINQLMAEVPGVYVRQEDGYGLRPNIGIRGATSERSQKITLMEDGMLIAPAPYSAPAAYYFPNVNRMDAVEVYKGPSSIHYGPHTIGGAVNLVTPAVPAERTGALGFSLGSDAYYKVHGTVGDQLGQWGYHLDLLSFGADGFKELDGGGDTGFVRNDVNLKAQWQSAPEAGVDQLVQIKAGYADEDSDETYLGLTDEDFQQNPLRRYAASALDHFTSEHQQIHVIHSARFNEQWQMHTKAYVNRFDRSWNKFDGLFPTRAQYQESGYANRVSAAMIFANAQSDPQRLALIRGDENSDGSLEQTLDITDNARQYGSHGVEVTGVYKLDTHKVQHKITAGMRFHHDYVERDHSVRGYQMSNGALLWDGNTDYLNKALNKASTDAFAAFISDEMTVGDWLLTAGVRAESIEGRLQDDLAQDDRRNDTQVLLPGVGVFYQLSDQWGLLAGVNKGFSPNSPGAAESVDPEESTNYEYGVRYEGNRAQLDAIGFFSDYQNLLGRCRVSDAGCEAGEEFNGGNVEVAGLEFSLSYDFTLAGSWFLPVSLVYTYTESAFQQSFESSFSQWGSVEKGDELAYIPRHQGQLGVGLEHRAWSFGAQVKHVGEMRETPGHGGSPADELSAYTTLDVSAAYVWQDRWTLQLVGENITEEQAIVSRRPFGARPNAPRIAKATLTYAF